MTGVGYTMPAFYGRPHIGGGNHTNLHLTGLLLMTCGLKEAVSMLPADDWQALL
jgi:hypothetical protein